MVMTDDLRLEMEQKIKDIEDGNAEKNGPEFASEEDILQHCNNMLTSYENIRCILEYKIENIEEWNKLLNKYL